MKDTISIHSSNETVLKLYSKELWPLKCSGKMGFEQTHVGNLCIYNICHSLSVGTEGEKNI